jgi:hypothetical protein
MTQNSGEKQAKLQAVMHQLGTQTTKELSATTHGNVA